MRLIILILCVFGVCVGIFGGEEESALSGPPVFDEQPKTTEKEKKFQESCQKIYDAKEKLFLMELRERFPDKELDEVALKKIFERSLIFRSQKILGLIDLYCLRERRPFGYMANLPNRFDLTYAIAHKSKHAMNEAIDLGMTLSRCRRNIMATLAILETEKDREPLEKALDRMADWDQKLINLIVDPQANELSKAYYDKFSHFWKAQKEEEEKIYQELLKQQVRSSNT